MSLFSEFSMASVPLHALNSTLTPRQLFDQALHQLSRLRTGVWSHHSRYSLHASSSQRGILLVSIGGSVAVVAGVLLRRMQRKNKARETSETARSARWELYLKLFYEHGDDRSLCKVLQFNVSRGPPDPLCKELSQAVSLAMSAWRRGAFSRALALSDAALGLMHFSGTVQDEFQITEIMLLCLKGQSYIPLQQLDAAATFLCLAAKAAHHSLLQVSKFLPGECGAPREPNGGDPPAKHVLAIVSLCLRELSLLCPLGWQKIRHKLAVAAFSAACHVSCAELMANSLLALAAAEASRGEYAFEGMQYI
jgi:hypothetical protein